MGEAHLCLSLLGGADQESQAPTGGDQGGSNGQDGFEALDGAESDYVERSASQSFGAGVLYIDVRQCKGASDFAKEGCLLVIGFDQSRRDMRSPEFNRKAGKSGAGAEVGDGASGRCRSPGTARARP